MGHQYKICIKIWNIQLNVVANNQSDPQLLLRDNILDFSIQAWAHPTVLVEFTRYICTSRAPHTPTHAVWKSVLQSMPLDSVVVLMPTCQVNALANYSWKLCIYKKRGTQICVSVYIYTCMPWLSKKDQYAIHGVLIMNRRMPIVVVDFTHKSIFGVIWQTRGQYSSFRVVSSTVH